MYAALDRATSVGNFRTVKRAERNQIAMIVRIMADMDEQKCQHYWVIEAAKGPVSRGICKLCQLVREFKNTVVVDQWNFRSPKSQSAE